MEKYIILHWEKHEYQVTCQSCGWHETRNDDRYSSEVVKINVDSCEECLPGVRRDETLYMADGARMGSGGAKHPDGSWSRVYDPRPFGFIPPEVQA